MTPDGASPDGSRHDPVAEDTDTITATVSEEVVESVDSDAIEEVTAKSAGETFGSHGTFFSTLSSLSSGNVGMSPADSAKYADVTRQAIRTLYPELVHKRAAPRPTQSAKVRKRLISAAAFRQLRNRAQ
jgi:hypothetical protein